MPVLTDSEITTGLPERIPLFPGGLEVTDKFSDGDRAEFKVGRSDTIGSVAEVQCVLLVRDLLAAPLLAGLFAGDCREDCCRGR